MKRRASCCGKSRASPRCGGSTAIPWCGRAGISRLPALEARGIVGATVAGDSARIGDARSVWQNGRLSALTPGAERVGGRLGMPVPDFAEAVIRSCKGEVHH
jgi:hypothetical protein